MACCWADGCFRVRAMPPSGWQAGCASSPCFYIRTVSTLSIATVTLTTGVLWCHSTRCHLIQDPHDFYYTNCSIVLIITHTTQCDLEGVLHPQGKTYHYLSLLKKSLLLGENTVVIGKKPDTQLDDKARTNMTKNICDTFHHNSLGHTQQLAT